ncbi:MAG: penicillin-binding protein 2 [Candidatus Coatesbacteria bacterium]|nr:penicillin-binding protein 2 [Candidatus Coatesbacteria bacterium]
MAFEVKYPRLIIGFAVALTIWIGLEVKLLKIQVLQSAEYRNLATRQQYHRLPQYAERGAIFDANGYQLALNVETVDVVMNGRQIKDKSEYFRKVAELGLDAEVAKKKFNADKGYIVIAKGMPPQIDNSIKKRRIEGLYTVKSSKRYYPLGYIGRFIIGFLNSENNGSGIEESCNHILKGKDGWRWVRFNGRGEPFSSVGLADQLPNPGLNIYLTIDKDIQTIVEDELKKAVEDNEAKNAFAVLVKVKTGEIVSLATYPSMSLESDSTQQNSWLNRPIQEVFEPGSIFKIFLSAGALDKGYITENTMINCMGGKATFAKDFTITDSHKMRTSPFRDVLIYSSNIGTIQMSKRVPREEVYEIYKRFGFGQPTGIPLSGEQRGYLIRPELWSGVTKYSMAIGYGVSVTGIQLVMATAAIANKGKLMAPILVSRIEDNNGRVIQSFKPIQVRQVIAPETSRILTSILEDVVKKGTGKKAAVKETQIAGKTSTAKKLAKNNTGYSNKQYKSAFIGYFPSKYPVYALLVVVDEPTGHFFYGGDVAAPVFGRIAQKLLSLRNVSEVLEK